jgi:hypothetical protein
MWVLTFIQPNKVPQVLCKKNTVELLQLEKKKFEATGKYRTGKLQIRTEEGFKHKPVL